MKYSLTNRLIGIIFYIEKLNVNYGEKFIIFNQDRKFIGNKYHKTDEPFNPYARMVYHGYDYDNGTSLEDEEIKGGLLRLHEKIKTLPHPVAKAYAIRYVLENTKIDINEHDFFVGFWSVN